MASSSADIGILTKGTDWNSKKVSELKKALTERNLPTTGNKALLIQRLQSNELNNESIQQYIDNTRPAAPTNETSPPSSIAQFLNRQGRLQSPNPSSSISRTKNADEEAAFTRNARGAAAKTKPTGSEDEELKNRASRAGIEVPMNIDFANQVSMYLSTYQITGEVKILEYLKRILEGIDGDLVARPAAETSALTKLLLRNESFTEEDAGKALLEAKVCCPHREPIDLANYEV